mgnify:CR=1 FL=1
MVMRFNAHPTLISVLLVIVSAAAVVAARRPEGLTPGFYEQSCPSVFTIVKDVVASAVQSDARMAGSLLRLHFHDCFVNVCAIHSYLRT